MLRHVACGDEKDRIASCSFCLLPVPYTQQPVGLFVVRISVGDNVKGAAVGPGVVFLCTIVVALLLLLLLLLFSFLLRRSTLFVVTLCDCRIRLAAECTPQEYRYSDSVVAVATTTRNEQIFQLRLQRCMLGECFILSLLDVIVMSERTTVRVGYIQTGCRKDTFKLGVGKTPDRGTFSVLFQSPAPFRLYKSTEIGTEVSVVEGRRVFVQESHQNEEIQ
jgi:hypothetical protein